MIEGLHNPCSGHHLAHLHLAKAFSHDNLVGYERDDDNIIDVLSPEGCTSKGKNFRVDQSDVSGIC